MEETRKTYHTQMIDSQMLKASGVSHNKNPFKNQDMEIKDHDSEKGRPTLHSLESQ